MLNQVHGNVSLWVRDIHKTCAQNYHLASTFTISEYCRFKFMLLFLFPIKF